MCTVCSGSGRVRGGGRHLENCTACDGRGFSTRAQCEMCKGSGEVSGEQSVSVHVRPGLLDGDQLRLRGLGEAPAGEGEGEPGDLLLTVRLRVHPVFRMQRRELHVELPVPAFTLLTGGKVAVPLPVGEEIVSLPAGENVAHELRLAGRGFPGRGGEPAGDAVVSIRPVLPGALTPEQRKMLARLEKQFERKSRPTTRKSPDFGPPSTQPRIEALSARRRPVRSRSHPVRRSAARSGNHAGQASRSSP